MPTAYIGPHLQTQNEPNWPQAAALFPANTPLLFIDNVQSLRVARLSNPNLYTMLRHHFPLHFDDAPYSVYKDRARSMFLSFVDDTFRQYAQYVSAILEGNEYCDTQHCLPNQLTWLRNQGATYTPPHNAVQYAQRLKWVQAVNEVWSNEFKTQADYSHIDLIAINLPPGNSIPLEYARVTHEHGNLVGIHPYTAIDDDGSKKIRFDDGKWYGGRWRLDDVYLRANGVRPRYIGTESGPIGTVVATGGMKSNDGWLLPTVLNGDLPRYIEVVIYRLNMIAEWNAIHNRYHGEVLFNTGAISNDWQYFELDTPHLTEIANAERAWTPNTPPPPPPPPPPQTTWNKTVILVPQNISRFDYGEICNYEGYPTKTEVTFSADAAFDRPSKAATQKVIVYNADAWGGRQVLLNWVNARYSFQPPTVIEWKEYAAKDPTNEIVVDRLLKHETKVYKMRQLNEITTIAIHHTATPATTTVDAIARYHVQTNDWPGIGYHYVILQDGYIYKTNYAATKSYHVGDANSYALGVSLVGNFIDSPPPQEQLDAARKLVQYLRETYPSIDEVVGHRDIVGAQTRCPGDTYIDWLSYVKGE